MDLQVTTAVAADAQVMAQNLRQWAMTISKVGVWVFDLDQNLWTLSAEAAAMFGFAADATCQRKAALERLSSIERLRLETAWNRLIEEGVAYDLEYVIEWNGMERWVWERAECECGSDGEIRRVRGMVQDITERREAERKIRLQANYDALTALPNRYMLDEYLEKSIALARRRNERMALMAIDLDRFKEVNDTYGHAIGDQVLQAAAKRMKACLRASDMLARQGGDEFIAVLQSVDFDATVGLVALRMIEEVSRPYQIAGHDISIGASVGIALLPDDGSRIDEILKHADSALYGAKHNGRETLHFFQHDASSLCD